MDAEWLPRFDRLGDAAPHARLLSNGRFSALLTSAGTGRSTWRDTQLTAWQGDRTEDADGWFVYLRDLDCGVRSSAGYQPVRGAPAECGAQYTPGCVTIGRHFADIESVLAVCVAPDVDVEVRQLTLTNRSDQARRIEVTSYLEVVLDHAAAYAAHPAFSKLFVETEFVPAGAALLARRRPRSRDETPPWMAGALLGDGPLQHETDRARFLGSTGTRAAPHALATVGPLSGSVGSVLDPVFVLRRVAVVPPRQSVRLHALLGAGADRAATLAALASAGEPAALATVFERAATRERELTASLGIDATTAEAFQELAGALLYGHPALRSDAAAIARARGSAAQLWHYGLGGAPFFVVWADREADLARVAELLTARAYWANTGIRVDAVILCGAGVGPAAAALAPAAPGGGTLFVRRRDELPAADVEVLLAAAQMVVEGGAGVRSLAPAGTAVEADARPSGGDATDLAAAAMPAATRAGAAEDLRFDNGIGGFSADGTEYVIRIATERRPPLAWVNIMANPGFGCLVSASGAAHTWSRNSHEHRLTPWYNDPLGDPHGEALYVRDDASGALWSPQPGPAADGGSYEVRHGFGYTTWRHRSHGLDQEVTAFVAARDPVRIVRVRLTNEGGVPRRVSVVSYQRLVLGVLACESGRFVVCEHDAGAKMLLARNRINGEFSDAEVFASAVIEDPAARITWTTDRTAFIGRNGSLAAPAGLMRGGVLDRRTGAGLDPCFALQVECEIAAGATLECAFLLGEAPGREAAAAIVRRHRCGADLDAALAAVRDSWHGTLRAVQIETPVPAIDLMVNGWLLYQAMSCRLWGRSALYQSGGAFGFRDQLQDSAALVYSRPELTRAQILLHAAHQFVEGDVLHWWHPPLSRGTRTRFSDDLLWLPYIACFYARTTGDWGVFDETVGFLSAPPLADGQDEAYLLPAPAAETADVYAHCCRAIERSLTRGAHSLPLMGTGDWNDGMNRVGRAGRGESVWLGFFLYQLLADFAPVCARRGDDQRARRYAAFRHDLGVALNAAGWDGAWYRRAYYDDGEPLGSAQNLECRIDALAQAWAVISGAAPPERAVQAMEALDAQLVDRESGLIHLLWPPFDRDPHDPGYIKGYVPGIRENGGQYTHAATWVVRAFAELGRRDRAAAYLEMLSPIHHASTPDGLAVYRVEPYAVAADVYGVAPHRGRGGWTWYTGSAAWLYRIALESVLGVHLEEGRTLIVEPCIPDTWAGFRVHLRLPGSGTRYEIAVENPSGNAAAVVSAAADGAPAAVASGAARVALAQDGAAHHVRVVLGSAQ